MNSEQVMIYYFNDWKGVKRLVRVAGTILASYPSEFVYLVQTSFNGFKVYYGLQETEHETLVEAFDAFYHCVRHAIENNQG